MRPLLLVWLAAACAPQDESDCVHSFYADRDGDRHGVPEATVTGCVAPPGYETTHDDCDDGNSAIHPDAVEQCNGIDDDCDGEGDSSETWYTDEDRDGYGTHDEHSCEEPPFPPSALVAGDCDDTETMVHPGADEYCNGVDDDCDGTVDDDPIDIAVWYADWDGDGYAGSEVKSCVVPEGAASDPTDCDDTELAVNPDAQETCNEIDDDCDALVDLDDPELVPVQYADDDGDGFGDPTTVMITCDPSAGWVDDPTDCDDAASAVNPGVDEICNAIDDNCDGLTDDDDPSVTGRSVFYVDADGDGLGAALSGSAIHCLAPTGYAETHGDCDDSDPGVGLPTTMYRDADDDGYGGDAEERCAGPSSSSEWILTAGDCDDADPWSHPTATEFCDAVDNDCDGKTDNDAVYTHWYTDDDADGYGDDTDQVDTCKRPEDDQVLVGGDCDDAVAATHPGAAEVCVNSADDDCDQVIDPCTIALTDADWSLVGPTALSVSTRGFSVLATDLNGDGAADLVATAPEIDPPVYAFFGPRSGSAALEDADLTFASIGASSLAGGMGAADVDGDGTTDLLLGAPDDHIAYLFLGPVTVTNDADAEFLAPDHGPSATVAKILRDFDGDGSPDVAVNAIDLFDSALEGTVYVAPATTTETLSLPRSATYTYVGAPSDELGTSIVLIGDMDGDDIDDLAVGATGPHAVFVLAGGDDPGTYSMADAAIGSVCSDRTDGFGYSIAATDYDRDGYADLFVGAPEDGASVYGFMGPLMDLLNTADAHIHWVGAEALGYSVATGQDVDADGAPDVLLGAYDSDRHRGSAYLSLRGAQGVVDVTDLLSFESRFDGNAPGYAVEFVPDWSGDGNPEVAFGEPFFSREGESGTGRVDVVFSENLY